MCWALFLIFFLIKLRKRNWKTQYQDLPHAAASPSSQTFTDFHWFSLVLTHQLQRFPLQYLSLNFVLIQKIRVCIHLVENGWNSVSIYSNGLPVQSELDALQVYIENVDKDSLLQLALSSIPEDVRLHGSDTILQLNQKASFTKTFPFAFWIY